MVLQCCVPEISIDGATSKKSAVKHRVVFAKHSLYKLYSFVNNLNVPTSEKLINIWTIFEMSSNQCGLYYVFVSVKCINWAWYPLNNVKVEVVYQTKNLYLVSFLKRFLKWVHPRPSLKYIVCCRVFNSLSNYCCLKIHF